MFDRFTDRLRKVMALANGHAHRTYCILIEPRHILMGLLTEGSGVGVGVLRNSNCPPSALAEKLHFTLDEKPPKGLSKLSLHPISKGIVCQMIEEARALGHNYCGTEHLILALARCGDRDVEEAFNATGVTYSSLRPGVWLILGGTDDPPAPAPPPPWQMSE